MRCPDCNKFVSTDSSSDPEVSDLEIADGVITGSVRILNTCADCSTELTEATFDLTIDVSGDIASHSEEPGTHQFEVAEASAERTDRRETHDRRNRVIPVRFQKTFYGARVGVDLSCTCQPEGSPPWCITLHWEDAIQASYMDAV